MIKLLRGLITSFVCVLLTGFTAHDAFEIKKDAFSIVFPGKPMEYDSMMDSAVKVTLRTMTYKADPETNENLFYSFSYVDYPSNYVHSSTTADLLEEFFRISIDRAVSNVQGKLIKEENIKLNNFPGKYTIVEYGGGKALIHAKSYLVRSRFYVLQVICAPDKNNNGAMEDFFDSFALLK